MRRLLLLRHAKSDWSGCAETDHDRPLNQRGERAAPLIGQLLASHSLQPDRILTSTAVRARTTARLVADAASSAAEIVETGSLYLATPGTILDVIAEQPRDLGTILVVGHNPGMERLALTFAGSVGPLVTAMLVALELDDVEWSDLAPDSPMRLIGVWRPRELE